MAKFQNLKLGENKLMNRAGTMSISKSIIPKDSKYIGFLKKGPTNTKLFKFYYAKEIKLLNFY